MSIEVKVPVLPESVADATLLAWHKQPGDAVKRDENLVDIETDKVVLDVPAPTDGVIKELLMAEGATVTSSEVIAIIEEGATATTPPPSDAPATGAAVAAPAATASAPAMSPAVRKLMNDNNLDPSHVAGSGRDGRITKEDVVSHLAATPASPPAAQAAPSTKPAPTPAAKPPVPSGDRAEQRIPMTRLRARIAERLMEAQSTTAMLTTFNEVNMKPAMDLRKKYKDAFEKQHGVKLGFMSFFVKAATQALQKFPMVNSSVDGTDMVYHGFYDIGIAVSGPRGLVVPILRNTDEMNYADVEKNIGEYAQQARDGSLSLDALTGGTFSITNGGIFGSLMSTPILNPPQSGILGMHKIQERPMVENGEIVVRPMMYLALTYDHRVIDGREAVQFLVAIKDAVEDPARLLLDL